MMTNERLNPNDQQFSATVEANLGIRHSLAIRIWEFVISAKPREVQARRNLAHFGVGNFLGLAERLVCRRHNHVLQQLGVGRIERLRVNLDGGDAAVALGGDLDGAAAAGGLDGVRGELRLHLFHLLLHSRSLFHQFSNARHIAVDANSKEAKHKDFCFVFYDPYSPRG